MNRPLRVMHVIEAMHEGGAESLVVEHVRLASPDIHPVVVALNRGGPAYEAAAAAGAEVHLLAKGRDRLGGLLRLAGLMRRGRIDVVNGHNPTAGLYGALAGRLAGVPVVVRTEHNVHWKGRHSRVYPPLERLSTALSDRVLCCAEAVRGTHVPRMRWAAPRFVTIPNGISAGPPPRPRHEVRRGLGLDDGAFVVLSVGSLTYQKAQHVLIEAFSRLAAARPEAVLLLAGDGPRAGELRAVADASGLGGRVRLLGSRRDVADLQSAGDLFALSSVREGLPVVVLEAMRAGRPVVATEVGGTAEAVEHGVTGLVVPPLDAAALAASLTALAGDPDRRRAMGEAGRRRWAERFTAERMVRATEELYRALRSAARPAAMAGLAGGVS